jgi:hypothetical protein
MKIATWMLGGIAVTACHRVRIPDTGPAKTSVGAGGLGPAGPHSRRKRTSERIPHGADPYLFQPRRVSSGRDRCPEPWKPEPVQRRAGVSGLPHRCPTMIARRTA